jgi:hypothetical protein
MKKIFDKMLEKVIEECKKMGISVGEEIVIDSSPFEKKNNGDATYSTHYRMMGYKWHNVRCVKTDIPLEYHVSTITEYDGRLTVPLIYRIKMKHNIHPKRLFADGHYSDAKSLMRMREYFGIEPICHIGKHMVLKPETGIKELKEEYQKLWKSKYFKVDADVDYMKWFLIMHDRTKLLENFYHNQMLKKYEKDPKGYEKKYTIRKTIEHGHGREKRLTEIKNIQANNIEKFNTHIGMHVVSMLALALVRLQNGIRDNLTLRGGLV